MRLLAELSRRTERLFKKARCLTSWTRARAACSSWKTLSTHKISRTGPRSPVLSALPLFGVSGATAARSCWRIRDPSLRRSLLELPTLSAFKRQRRIRYATTTMMGIVRTNLWEKGITLSFVWRLQPSACRPQHCSNGRLRKTDSPRVRDCQVFLFVDLLHERLCSFGFSTQAVLGAFPGISVRSIQTRFSSPVLPGATLETRMWREGPEWILFETLADGKVALSGGAIQISSAKL